MSKAVVTALALGVAVAGVAGCGGDSTTVVSSTTPTETTTTTTSQAKTTAAAKNSAPQAASEPAQSSPGGAPPKVTGLTLPEAKKQLSAAGFKADVSNTDTALGIIVPENYTVCKQSPARGKVVPVLAQKYGC